MKIRIWKREFVKEAVEKPLLTPRNEANKWRKDRCQVPSFHSLKILPSHGAHVNSFIFIISFFIQHLLVFFFIPTFYYYFFFISFFFISIPLLSRLYFYQSFSICFLFFLGAYFIISFSNPKMVLIKKEKLL